MLRIHFTSHDLQNIRIARRPDPLWELVCSICRLQTGQGPLEFGQWRHAAHHRLRKDPALVRSVHLLRTLIPPVGYFPDFLTPPAVSSELDAGLDLIRGTTRAQLSQELALLAESRRTPSRMPSWTTTLGTAHDDGLAALTGALSTYHRTLLRPFWTHLRDAVGNDVDARARALLEGGTQALFDGLRPMARWNAPVLEVDFPVDRDLYLEGRGLLLVPSYFCWRRPTALADPDLPPVLVYPVEKAPLSAAGVTQSGEGGLVRLLGRTRAAVLTQVGGRNLTTSEVARAVGVSLPSVSYQIGVLREGGLVTSRRDGKYVVHTATRLGVRLLSTGSPAAVDVLQTDCLSGPGRSGPG